ncbi:MAG: IMP dehydrogenase [Candidatus Omnitrophica bacterium]|nr:IMP dehydrogenase [Candidatus Omnitrophota bacterium]
MAKRPTPTEFVVVRDEQKCISCQACVRMCANDAHVYDAQLDTVSVDNEKCVGCHFCETICPTGALTIQRNPSEFKLNANWDARTIKNITKQAQTGGVLLAGMGCDRPYPIYWDHILLNASQVTNPSIDPLREPMELRTYIGRKPDVIKLGVMSSEFVEKNKKLRTTNYELRTQLSPQLKLETPILFSAMSYGSISLNACKSLARAAASAGTFYNTGEGGLHKDLYQYGANTIVQVASGRFGVHKKYLQAAAAIEIKIGQGAKPGIGGHLPGEKVSYEISQTRMIPEGTDALSPAPHHDIYSIEDLKQLIYALKEATRYQKPVGVKISAVHNVAPIASGIVRSGADFVAIDGLRGGTGAAPTVIRDNVGIPIELAIAVVDQRLREEGIRNQASLIAAGGIRNSADIIKAIAIGADAVYIGTAALVAMGCNLCQKCYTGKCNWGLATQDPYLTKRLNPDIGTERLVNLLRAWSLEIKEMLGGMGINAIESLRGNREQLRGVGLSDTDLKLLGIKPAGEAW